MPIEHEGEVASVVLAERDCTLLTVEYFERPVVVDNPVEDVEGESLEDGLDHRVALFVLVDELALVGRADVEPAVVAEDTLLGASS